MASTRDRWRAPVWEPADAGAELDALAKGFRECVKHEDERFRLATDCEFWFVLCFRSREEKDAFHRRGGEALPIAGCGERALVASAEVGGVRLLRALTSAARRRRE